MGKKKSNVTVSVEQVLDFLETGPKTSAEIRIKFGSAGYLALNQALASRKIRFDLVTQTYVR